MTNKITRFPSRGQILHRRRLSERKVVCQVSSRWLQFGEHIQRYASDSTEYLYVDVMTSDHNERPHKLCELIIDPQDLRVVLDKLAVVER